MNRSKWDQRIQRATHLAGQHPFAAEVLHFYRHIAEFQKGFYGGLERAGGDGTTTRTSNLTRKNLDFDRLLSSFPEFLSTIKTVAPPPIAGSANTLASQGVGRWRDLLNTSWQTVSEFQPDPGDIESSLTWIFLQPYAEYLADHSKPAPRNHAPARCPFCAARPLVGVLRPEGDGAKRFLICALCSTEWAFGRILCPACGQEAVEKLAIYTADQFRHVRVEACDACYRYIKTVDLTKNGLVVPVVDELATIPLNLWAQEHGYGKLQANLLGI